MPGTHRDLPAAVFHIFCLLTLAARLSGDQQHAMQVHTAKTLARRLHYHPPDRLLTGPSLLESFSEPALERFLDYLAPVNMNVFFSSNNFQVRTSVDLA